MATINGTKLSFKYVADKLYSALTGINASDIIFVAKENAIYVKTEFEGPKEYTNNETSTYPCIVIKIEYSDKNVIFSE